MCRYGFFELYRFLLEEMEYIIFLGVFKRFIDRFEFIE